MKRDINALLAADMDRLSFLKYIALALGAVSGLGMLLRAFNPEAAGKASSVPGYGSSTYGGYREGIR